MERWKGWAGKRWGKKNGKRKYLKERIERKGWEGSDVKEGMERRGWEGKDGNRKDGKGKRNHV